MSDRKKTRGGNSAQRGSRVRSSAAKPAGKPDLDWNEHLILSFKLLEDPSPEKMAQAIGLVEGLAAARVSRARPGMLRIDVMGKEKEKVREALQSLKDWDVSDEAMASMPVVPPYSSS